MRGLKKFFKIGLTGGIASGKSTVAAMFQELGTSVIDADKAGHLVIEAGCPAYNQLVECFGRGILSEEGLINRKLLGDIVFGNPEARRKLENIVHPRLIKQVKQEMQQLRSDGISLVMIEAAVLVETGTHTCCNRIIVVYLPVEQQIERLRNRDNLDINDILERLDAQLPWKAKLELADYVIDNSGSLKETRCQVDQIWDKLKEYH